MPISWLNDIDFQGKIALIRADLNVPLTDQREVTDDTKIQAVLPTVNKIIKEGGGCILMSHLGRPHGRDLKYSLRHILPSLEKILKRPVKFIDDCIGFVVESKASTLRSGEVMLLENLRFYQAEQDGDVNFANQLSQLGDVYVNDAFGTSHRSHASTATIAQFFHEKCMGEVMRIELANLERLFLHTERPFTAIIGGAKVSDKIGMLENLMDKVDSLILGGGMAYTFYKALGGSVGKSLVENDKLVLATKLIEKATRTNTSLHLPVDSVIADQVSEEAQIKTSESNAIPANWMGLDIGPKARQDFYTIILKSKTILWNGPMGLFERRRFSEGTKVIGEAISEATKSNNAFSLIGGGDSAAAATQLGIQDKVTYISTGGGALLQYVEGKLLPGLEALR